MPKWIPPEGFYKMLPRKYSAASFIVPYKDKYLFLKKSYGAHPLTIPGGVAELNESWAETAKREAKEEIGLDLEVDRLANVIYQTADPKIPGRGDSVQVHFFSKPLTEKQYESIKVDNDEIIDYLLMSREEIFKMRDETQINLLKYICFALDGVLYAEVEL